MFPVFWIFNVLLYSAAVWHGSDGRKSWETSYRKVFWWSRGMIKGLNWYHEDKHSFSARVIWTSPFCWRHDGYSWNYLHFCDVLENRRFITLVFEIFNLILVFPVLKFLNMLFYSPCVLFFMIIYLSGFSKTVFCI